MRAYTLAICLLALGCQAASARRSLLQDNPFLTPQGTPAPVSRSSPSVEPVTEPGTAIAPATDGGDACACTTDGFSGSVNTSRIGCGQWDIVAGSNAFTCYVEDPASCTAVTTSESASLPGAAYRACPADEAVLPTIGLLLTSSPQLTSYIAALRTAGLGNIPGSSVTVLAPTNAAFASALGSGLLTEGQLQGSLRIGTQRPHP
ncbi:hypothetical protein ACKKBG_A06110 [Auxenochlorella protothecoides x Auxenochlorella symbiontica]